MKSHLKFVVGKKVNPGNTKSMIKYDAEICKYIILAVFKHKLVQYTELFKSRSICPTGW